MAEFQVVCVKKPFPNSSVEHITHFGVLEDGKILIYTAESIINFIESSEHHSYYTVARSNKAYLEIRCGENGIKYLRSLQDDIAIDSLLTLDECST